MYISIHLAINSDISAKTHKAFGKLQPRACDTMNLLGKGDMKLMFCSFGKRQMFSIVANLFMCVRVWVFVDVVVSVCAAVPVLLSQNSAHTHTTLSMFRKVYDHMTECMGVYNSKSVG